VLAFHELRFDPAFRLSNSAWRVLTKTMVPGRAAHCQILLARLWLKAGFADRARAIGREALEHAGDDPSPSLRFHANLVEGEIHELQGRWQQALECYEAARHEVEDLRGRVDTEDLRISLLKDKLAVYEGLVALCLDSPAAQESGSATRALLLIQQAKSRSLADRLGTFREHAEQTSEDPAIQELRRDLNWVYRQVDLSLVLDRVFGSSRVQALREKAREMEAKLAEKSSQAVSSIVPPSDNVHALQQALHDGELLLEYYESRGILYVVLLSSHGVEAVRLGSFAPVRHALKLLQFQLGRFGWGKDRTTVPHTSLEAAADHFRELYRLLLGPVEAQIAPYRHLIVSPHRELHGLPFAALNNGDQALADRFGISATPSASVFALCRARNKAPADRPALVMAVSDVSAPRMEDEAQAVARILPGSVLFAGEQATLEAFHREAPKARMVHLAVHGIFRRDNPMFSALQFADGRLSLLDLNRLNLNVDLLTLSACNTGTSVAVGGDELLGLMRGFLLAGARSLLVTLWEIDDSSTQDFMIAFYREIACGAACSSALQSAAREVRGKYPHPYYWAPFLLVGDPDGPL
jgi:CHAT domain-containing protein